MKYIKKYESKNNTKSIDLGPIKDIMSDILDDFNCEISYQKKCFIKTKGFSFGERDAVVISDRLREGLIVHDVIKVIIDFFDKDNRKVVNIMNKSIINRLKEYYFDSTGNELIIFIKDVLGRKKIHSIDKAVRFYITTDKEILKNMDSYFKWKMPYSDQKYTLL